MAIEERNSEGSLQRLQLSRDGRLRDVEARGSGRDGPQFSDCEEVP